MADRLTQLQDAVDQLAHQFVASVYYVNKHHDLKPVSPTDKIREGPLEGDGIEPHGLKGFEDGQRELAKDLIVREQQIELLISSLPGLENTTEEQQKGIRKLEEELLAEEERRKKAVGEKEVLLEKLEVVIRSIRRP